jgi:hypothetical protein
VVRREGVQESRQHPLAAQTRLAHDLGKHGRLDRQRDRQRGAGHLLVALAAVHPKRVAGVAFQERRLSVHERENLTVDLDKLKAELGVH